jgi:hypothetical protein
MVRITDLIGRRASQPDAAQPPHALTCKGGTSRLAQHGTDTKHRLERASLASGLYYGSVRANASTTGAKAISATNTNNKIRVMIPPPINMQEEN